MVTDYIDLKQAIEGAGFYTTFMPIVTPGDRMVCASHRSNKPERQGLGGNSFWVARRGDNWYIATWSNVVYRVSERARLLDLCLELLNRDGDRALCDSDLDQNTRRRFGLDPISDDEFDGLKSP